MKYTLYVFLFLLTEVVTNEVIPEKYYYAFLTLFACGPRSEVSTSN